MSLLSVLCVCGCVCLLDLLFSWLVAQVRRTSSTPPTIVPFYLVFYCGRSQQQQKQWTGQKTSEKEKKRVVVGNSIYSSLSRPVVEHCWLGAQQYDDDCLLAASIKPNTLVIGYSLTTAISKIRARLSTSFNSHGGSDLSQAYPLFLKIGAARGVWNAANGLILNFYFYSMENGAFWLMDNCQLPAAAVRLGQQ